MKAQVSGSPSLLSLSQSLPTYNKAEKRGSGTGIESEGFVTQGGRQAVWRELVPAGRCYSRVWIDPVVLPCRDGDGQSLQAGAISSGQEWFWVEGNFPSNQHLSVNSSDLGSFSEPFWSAALSPQQKTLLPVDLEVSIKSQAAVHSKFYWCPQRERATLGRDWQLAATGRLLIFLYHGPVWGPLFSCHMPTNFTCVHKGCVWIL